MGSYWRSRANKRREFRHVHGDPENVRRAPRAVKRERPVEIWAKDHNRWIIDGVPEPGEAKWFRWGKYKDETAAEQAIIHLRKQYDGVEFEVR